MRDSSPMQVNLDSEQFAHITSRVEAEDFGADLFDEGEEELVTKVIERDTLPRFYRYVSGLRKKGKAPVAGVVLYDDLAAMHKRCVARYAALRCAFGTPPTSCVSPLLCWWCGSVVAQTKHEQTFTSRDWHLEFSAHQPLAPTPLPIADNSGLDAARFFLCQLGITMPALWSQLKLLPNSLDVRRAHLFAAVTMCVRTRVVC